MSPASKISAQTIDLTAGIENPVTPPAIRRTQIIPRRTRRTWILSLALNTQSPDPPVGNTQNNPSRRYAEPSHSHWQYAEPRFSRWHKARRAQLLTSATRRTQPFPPVRRAQSLPLKEFLQKCTWSPDWRPASPSPTGDFMLINDDWASHDLTIDEKWAAFTKKVRELSGDKIDVATLVKPSGPSNSVLTTQWHFPTWVTESPFYGSVMDDTNSSLRDQSSTCIVGS
ncbi:hypothetical protein CDV36_015422 [Fusarium kuroshium]|uniref:Uncharacterized protein n=1 Tax=Fusarium kuroshium TaxID=2010991 RepID=A0A3M2RAI4_9HYPO|nr:hypothetical protein CDV36_015422 [Fusarium kuroshium]